MKRLSAVDALGRGAANVRANLELLVVTTLGSVAIALLVILSFLPWVATLGFDLDGLSSQAPDPKRIEDLFDQLAGGGELIARLGGFLLSLSLALTLASVIYCWYQGGILGLLVAADAQAPQGAGREPILFRIWSPRLPAWTALRCCKRSSPGCGSIWKIGPFGNCSECSGTITFNPIGRSYARGVRKSPPKRWCASCKFRVAPPICCTR